MQCEGIGSKVLFSVRSMQCTAIRGALAWYKRSAWYWWAGGKQTLLACLVQAFYFGRIKFVHVERPYSFASVPDALSRRGVPQNNGGSSPRAKYPLQLNLPSQKFRHINESRLSQ